MSEQYYSLILPNVHEYVRRGMDPNFPEDLLKLWRNNASGFSDVSLFWEGENKFILSPKPIDPLFINYIRDLVGYNDIQVASPENFSSEFCDDILNDSSCLHKIKSFIESKNKVYFIPWGATESVYKLLDALQTQHQNFVSEELPERKHYWSSLHFDSKVGFREMCSQLAKYNDNILIPKGFTCSTFNEAMEIISWFYYQNKPCVLKAASGVGGFGNVFLYEDMYKQSLDDVISYVKNMIRELPYFTNGAAVVEELVVSDSFAGKNSCSRSVFMSGQILPTGIIKIIGGGGDIRDENCYYAGAELGVGSPLSQFTDTLIPIMRLIGEAISTHGYRGHWGVNFMLSRNGTPIAIELNARRCGESHVYALAQRVYGDDWMSNRYILSRFPRALRSAYSSSIEPVLDAFTKTNKNYSLDTVLCVPCQTSWLNRTSPGISYMIFGPKRNTVLKVEEYLLEQLSIVGLVF